MLEITSHRNGEIVNWRNGSETDSFLGIDIAGIADPQALVKINGIPAARRDRHFSAPVRLTGRINKVTVSSHSKYGDFQQIITLAWDKKSFKRYAMRIDDNVFFLRNIAQERPKSLFDHFYLKNLKRIHDTYGARFILKCFYRDDHHGFEIKDVPDDYKSEFEDHSDWLHLAFHAWSEFPDRPYQLTSEARLIADYETVEREIIRFAGRKTFSPPTNVHWAMLPPAVFHVLRERGLRVLASGGFVSNRIIVNGEQVEIAGICDIGFFYEQDVAQHMRSERCFYDPDHDLFLSRTFFCANIDSVEEIVSKIKAEDRNAHSCEIMESVSHEQYAFPDYPNFLPDYFERLEASCRTLTDLGYRPVFFTEGIYGNTAWEK